MSCKMDLILLCISFAVIIAEFPGARAMPKEDDTAPSTTGSLNKEELKLQIGMDEEELGKVLKWIKTSKICIRDDKSSEKPVFHILDPDQSPTNWLESPYVHISKTDLWYQKFYDTISSILKRASRSRLDEDRQSTATFSIMKGCSGIDGSSSEAGNGMQFGKAAEKGTPIKEDIKIEGTDTTNSLKKVVKEALKYLADAYKKEDSSN